MKRTFDAIIVGAGPSGLNSARRLASSGLDVVVLEKKSCVGQNVVCTGVVGTEIFGKFNLPQNSTLTEFQDVRMISPLGTSIFYRHSSPFACVVDRKKFDRNLAGAAQAEGASLLLGRNVTDIRVNPSEAEIQVSGPQKSQETFRAKIVVLATGVDFRLKRKLGLGYPRDFLYGVQAEVDVENAQHPEIWVGRDVAPGAFAWVVPIKKNRARIGLITEKEPRAYFHKLLQRAIPEMTRKSQEFPVQYKAIVQGVQKSTTSDRILVVGEAAGQVKTTTGGGVYFGLLCSDIAAEVIAANIKKDRLSSKDLASYETEWRRVIKRELLVGYYTRKICGRLNDLELELLFQIAKNDGVFPLIQKMGKFDWHSDLILELVRKAPLRSIQSLGSKIARVTGHS